MDLAQTGSCIFENKNITMIDDGCDKIEGVYRLEFRDDQVKFVLINDECDRSQVEPPNRDS